ncbi:MAG: gamma-glutamyl-gamma-aminobutyrate hydrolase family protein [Anaerolineae bacterium]|jgi:putative glutamine amidotransferase
MHPPVIGISGYADRSARPPKVHTIALARAYVDAVATSGGAALILPPYIDRPLLRAAFDGLDGLILSGGGDIHPSAFGEDNQGLLWRVDEKRDRAELCLARWALADGTPMLAICRGAQVLNVAGGGTLIQDIPTRIPGALSHSCVAGRPLPKIAHSVLVEANSRLAALIGGGDVDVNSAHHQAADIVGDGLVVTARAPDGIIEGLEAPHHPFCIGVQWHPEVMINDYPMMRRLFEGLIDAVRRQ